MSFVGYTLPQSERMRAERAKLSRSASVAKAINYMMSEIRQAFRLFVEWASLGGLSR